MRSTPRHKHDSDVRLKKKESWRTPRKQAEGRSALDRHWAEVEGACRGERWLQSGFATLIQAMLSFGPGDRPTAAEVRIGIESAAREAL